MDVKFLKNQILNKNSFLCLGLDSDIKKIPGVREVKKEEPIG
jgi:hypothetical protein